MGGGGWKPGLQFHPSSEKGVRSGGVGWGGSQDTWAPLLPVNESQPIASSLSQLQEGSQPPALA